VNEACEQVRVNFRERWSPQQDSWFSYIQGRTIAGTDTSFIEERKGLKAIYDATELTKADKLNGIEWKGNVYLQSEARRRYYFNAEGSVGIGAFATPERTKGWNDWEAIEPGEQFWVFNLEKRKGKWTLEKPQFSSWDESVYNKVDIDATGKTPFDPIQAYSTRRLKSAEKAAAERKWSVARADAAAVVAVKPDDTRANELIATAELEILRDWRNVEQPLREVAIKSLVRRKDGNAVPIFLEALKEKYSGKTRERFSDPYTWFAWGLAQMGVKEAVPVIMEALGNTISGDGLGKGGAITDYLNALATLDGEKWKKFAFNNNGNNTIFKAYRDGIDDVKDSKGTRYAAWVEPEVRAPLDKILKRIGPASMLGGSKSGLALSRHEPTVRVRSADQVDMVLSIIDTTNADAPVGSFTFELKASDKEGIPYVATALKDAVLQGQPMIRPPTTAPVDGAPVASWIGLATQGRPPRVTFVVPGSPAERAGVRVGDGVVSVNSEEVGESGDVPRLIREAAQHGAADIEVARDGRRLRFSVTPTTPPEKDYKLELSRAILAGNKPLRGTAKEGGEEWPFEIRFANFDPNRGTFTGQIDWPTLRSLHEIEGELAGNSVIGFRETKALRRGEALLGSNYKVTLYGLNDLLGVWEKGGRNGPVAISIQAPPDGAEARPRRRK
jgi:hypothetical protein